MSLRDALLEERQKILAELESVENMLRVRCGWSPVEDDGKHRSNLLTANVVPSDTKYHGTPTAAIHYSNEFRDWLKRRAEPFTVGDFREFLESKYGAVNENSVRSPLKIAEEQGDIVVVEKGAGRRPTVYESADFQV